MPFSAALGLAGSAIGAIGAMGAAKAQAKAAMYDSNLRRQTENDVLNLSRQQMGFGQDLMRREEGLISYAQDQNRTNQMLALNQRDYGRGMVEDDRARTLAERDFQIARVQQMDRLAQQEYQRQLSELTNNSRITASERNFAIQQLEAAQRIAQSERNWQMDMLTQDRSRLQSEREEAMGYLDYNQGLAREAREFDIEQLFRGQGIAQSERAQALGYLDQSRDIAARERAQDEAQFERNASRLDFERGFQEDEYRKSRAQAMSERMADLERRSMLDEATNRYSGALEQALTRFGELAPVDYLGEEDVRAEAALRERTAIDDINSMADRVASVNEANLIRGGVDASTRATDERARTTAMLSQEMAKAREAARSSATTYIAGINDQLRLGDEMERARRGSGLSEIAATYGVPVQMLMAAPEIRSALNGPQFSDVGSAVYDRNLVSANNFGAPINVGSGNYSMGLSSAQDYNSPLSIGSGVLNRDISSANNYSSPVNIGSGIYDPLAQNLGMPMSGFTQFQSGIGPSAYDGSGQYNWQLPNSSSASSMFSSAMQGIGGVLNSRDQQAAISQQRAGQAAAGAGAAFTNFFKEAGSFLDGQFGKTPQQVNGLTPAPAPTSSTGTTNIWQDPWRTTGWGG